jgi:NADH:ubiquinone oxidoreductase subunit 5 (subunit L)/multisubunit Na+/H+ antiporter MnhA subunit
MNGALLAATGHLVWLLPLLPLLAAGLIAARLLRRRDNGEADEPITAGIASAAAFAALLLLCVLDLAALAGALPGEVDYGEWLSIGAVPVRLSFVLDAYSLPSATLVTLITWMALRFSATYLHRESGFARFFLGMCLFLAGMLLIVLAGNAVLAFVGWELAGFSSWLLIGYAWERPLATGNALFVFSPTASATPASCSASGLRCGRSALSNGTRWPADGSLGTVSARLLAIGFVIAALAKSAQLPFTPWIARALEGPTPSSAVFYGSLLVHAGVYLLLPPRRACSCRCRTCWLLAVAGLSTALYGSLCGLLQSDVKSALIFATVAQVGLMVFACGLGWFYARRLPFRSACLPGAPISSCSHPRTCISCGGRRDRCRAGSPVSAGDTPPRCSASGSSPWRTACWCGRRSPSVATCGRSTSVSSTR